MNTSPISSFPTNAQLAEWLAVQAEHHSGDRHKAYKRASRKALSWRREASEILRSGDSLRELDGVGAYLAGVLESWMDSPPEILQPPELRRDFLTYTESVWILDGWADGEPVRGDLQMHTTYSDGYGSINEMVDAALEMNYEYIAITDHSKGLRIAGGIDEETLASQRLEIDQINAHLEAAGHGLQVLQSIELNIGLDGSADLGEDALDGLDLVLGSFHSKLRVAGDQTDRYLAALDNPRLHILGHPRGRIYDFRIGLLADWDLVFRRAAELHKAVEIDAFPDRQDLNVELLEIARDTGVMISIGTDSHHPAQLDFMTFGLAAAARAGIAKKNILNLKTREQLRDWAAYHRTGGKLEG